MSTASSMLRSNRQALRFARVSASRSVLARLREITHTHKLSIEAGELLLLSGKWYITHAGLLKIAHRNHCSSIEVDPALELSSPQDKCWVFRATVHKRGGRQVYVGYGDADPSNINPTMRGAELRIAETRAVNRALRKAYGIGLCSAEELVVHGTSASPGSSSRPESGTNGQVKEMRVRNRLVSLIRRHQLDSEQVKRYAAEYCRTETLRDADRELVMAFVDSMEKWAKQDLAGLRAHLARYENAETQEVA